LSVFDAEWMRRRARTSGTALVLRDGHAVQGEGGRARDLVDRWCEAAASRGWVSIADWWTPAVEAVADAVADGRDPAPACTELGRLRAEDGAGLAETLDDLATLYDVAGLEEPPHSAVRALALAWAESSLQFLHALSCEDPLTGMATLAHLRTRMSELYREAERDGRRAAGSHAVLVVEVVDELAGRWERTLRLTDVAECMRAVFSGGETLARASDRRALVLVDRGTDLPRSVEALRRLLVDWRVGEPVEPPRIWVEGLPYSAESAIRLLDELAR
jgi:GGDEF domain-containing protein